MKGQCMRRSSKGKKLTGILMMAVMITVVFAFGCQQKPADVGETEESSIAEKAVPVKTMPASIRTLHQTIELSGNIMPLNEVFVMPKIPGKILLDISVDSGSIVKKGQVIGHLDDSLVKQQLEQAKQGLIAAESNRASLEAKYEVVKKDRVRLQGLYDDGVIPQQQLDHIEAELTATEKMLDLAAAQIEQAKAGINQMRILLGDHTVRATASGVVSRRLLDPGAMAAGPIVAITDQSTVKVLAGVSEKDISRISAGTPVIVKADAYPDRTFSGSIAKVFPTVDPRSRTVQIEIHIANSDKTLKSGMFARIIIDVGTIDSIAVPQETVLRVPGTGTDFVFIAKDNKAVKKIVSTGIRENQWIQISDGLKVGDPLIVSGQSIVRDGGTIAVTGEGESE